MSFGGETHGCAIPRENEDPGEKNRESDIVTLDSQPAPLQAEAGLSRLWIDERKHTQHI